MQQIVKGETTKEDTENILILSPFYLFIVHIQGIYQPTNQPHNLIVQIPPSVDWTSDSMKQQQQQSSKGCGGGSKGGDACDKGMDFGSDNSIIANFIVDNMQIFYCATGASSIMDLGVQWMDGKASHWLD